MSEAISWMGITGSWRSTNIAINRAVRQTVREAIAANKGIVTGGALRVDYFATDEALRRDRTGTHLKVIIPTSLDIYCNHYHTAAEEGKCTRRQARQLEKQLHRVKKLGRLVEMKYTAVNQETYYYRNTEVINSSTELVAFHVNGTAGVQHAIDEAQKRGLQVTIHRYTLKGS